VYEGAEFHVEHGDAFARNVPRETVEILFYTLCQGASEGSEAERNGNHECEQQHGVCSTWNGVYDPSPKLMFHVERFLVERDGVSRREFFTRTLMFHLKHLASAFGLC
jgi:hypothetical protein